jgi:hypothetical protein
VRTSAVDQLELPFAPRSAEELLARLRSYGLTGITALRLTRNRAVMVSYRGATLRMHRAFLDAPPVILRAIATFVSGRTRVERANARTVLLAYPISRDEQRPRRRREPRHAEDAPAEERLSAAHGTLNAERFGGVLRPISIRVSRRLKSRLGYYRVATREEPAEIVISRRHMRRHGWDEALATLVHEMVHQWQDERGGPVDHGRAFRAKAREVGVPAAARRPVTQ